MYGTGYENGEGSYAVKIGQGTKAMTPFETQPSNIKSETAATTTGQATNTQPTPAPTQTINTDTKELKTTDGLVNVIPPAPSFTSKDVNHTVLKGESLQAIAKKYGVTVDSIKQANKAYFDKLAEINKKNKTNVSHEAGVTLAIKTEVTAQDLAYTVQKGESLSGIAFNYYGNMQKTTIDNIYNANAAYFKKTKGILEFGAVLTLPAKGLTAPITLDSLNKSAGMYLVKNGDTLGKIAEMYYGKDTQWNKIYEANKDRVKLVGGSPMIYGGQWLVIPQ